MNLDQAAEAVQLFLEEAMTEAEVHAGSMVAEILNQHELTTSELKQLRQENASLKRKMGYLERRATNRLHGMVDLFTKTHDHEENA